MTQASNEQVTSNNSSKKNSSSDVQPRKEFTRQDILTSDLSQTIGLIDSKHYINRELSWLEFNRRVLHEAIDARTPLLERLKFMAIFESNLDEYFMVRVAGLKQQVEANVQKLTPDGRSPQDQLKDIAAVLKPMVTEQHDHFEAELRPEMKENGVFLLDYDELTSTQKKYVNKQFYDQIFPALTPLAVDPSHPFPYISNLSLNLAVVMEDPDSGAEKFARVKVPPDRFVLLPDDLRPKFKGKPAVWAGIPVEQVIGHNLEALFPGMTIKDYCFFRLTRNADLEVEEDEADDLLMAIEKELRKRRIGGSPVRMEIFTPSSDIVRETLMRETRLTENDVYEVHGLLDHGALMGFMKLPLPHLKDTPWTPVFPYWLKPSMSKPLDETMPNADFFSIIRKKDVMVHHPYHSFQQTVQQFITQAAHDPDVLAIKMTLYRTSGDSPIVDALIDAAENGKQVVALVEIKARFDEANNIVWARTLEKSGVHVVYGMVGLKTHTKIVLVVRRETDKIRRYVHIGTGNYNPKTARTYTDLGLLSCREELGADLSDLFNSLTGYSRQKTYRKLLIAPVSLRPRMMELIQREIEHSQAGREGRIIAQMNSLVDPAIIAKLYEASSAGVKIVLIVRGICCLRPGIEGVSDNIRVRSIVGRYLEHPRIFYFHNSGNEEVFIGSADWMPRNLDRRIEAVTPIEDSDLKNRLKDILQTMLADNRQSWDLQADGRYTQRTAAEGEPSMSAHNIFMETALRQAEE
ncbi:MAG: polyphosphate kinase 1 [Leptolyngbyaceae bacterium]|nr:polyphosphate kinase 1 [Leptolyngbyaceae bacterium]